MASTTKPRALDASEQDTALGLSLDVDERTLKRLVADVPGVLGQKADGRSQADAKVQVRLAALDTLLARLDTVAQRTCPAEVERYETELRDLAEEQTLIEAEILVLKRELQEAQKERAHKLEYDALAKHIIRYPPRVETEAAIERLRTTLEELTHERQGYRTIAEGIKEQYEDATAIFGKMQTYISDEIATREQEAVQTGADRDDNEHEDFDRFTSRRSLTPVEDGDTAGQGSPPQYTDSEGEEEGAAAEALPSTANPPAPTSASTPVLNPSAATFKPGNQSRVATGSRLKRPNERAEVPPATLAHKRRR